MSEYEKKRKFLRARDVYIYPSSNAKDGGNTNSEKNLAKITDKFSIKNFVVRAEVDDLYSGDSPLGLSITDIVDGETTYKNLGLKLTAGECVINGYYIQLSGSVLDIRDLIDINSVSSTTEYSIRIEIVLDAVEHVRGDGIDITTGIDMCYGVQIAAYASGEESVFYGLCIGNIVVSGDTKTISSVTIPKDKYSFIDSDTIMTKDGITINEYLDKMLRTLTSLNYWKDGNYSKTGLSDISLYIDASGGPFLRIGNADPINLSKRMVFAPKGGTTKSGTIGNKTDTNNGNTEAPGDADPYYVARADHDHDSRYLLNSTAYTNAPPQSVGNLDAKRVSADIFMSLNKLFYVSASGILLAQMLKSVGDLHIGTGRDGKEDEYTDGVSTIAGALQIFGDLEVGDKIKLNSEEGTITASKVYNAVWNDYADAVLRDKSKEYTPGDIISKKVNSDEYTLATEDNKFLVVGVYSDTYGHLLGGKTSEEETLKDYVPIAVSGNVYVKLVGTAKAGDLVTISNIPGVGKVLPRDQYIPGTVVGKVLEDKDSVVTERVLMQVALM